MVRLIGLIGLLGLCACSTSRAPDTVTSAKTGVSPSVLFAQGPIKRACMAAGRSKASAARCGCVQAIANGQLSTTDQRRGAGFFSDPHQAQVVRQSDHPGDEAFWLRWKAFGQRAASVCS